VTPRIATGAVIWDEDDVATRDTNKRIMVIA